ncbi:MAG: methyltransferase domain-containing protein [Candidatus Bathyarchaeia archaeon]|jgi:predicted SAM-dependent methyltransferase
MIIDLGCGELKRGNIGVDVRKTRSVDVIADLRQLPFKSEAFDHVYSSAVVEHFSHREVQYVLVEWIRILKKGGTIEIECPDLRARAFLFFLNPSWKNIEDIYGSQDYETNFHKCGFSYEILKDLLKSCGVKSVRRIIKGYKGVPFIPDCLHVKGIKS